MKKINSIKVAESGKTKNSCAGLRIVFSKNFISSLVDWGNTHPVRCRRTHNGYDLLDDIIGRWSNFYEENGIAYADLELFDLPEAEEMSYLIENAPEFVNSSIVVESVDEETDDCLICQSVKELYSIDLVGLGAATSSLFSIDNNNNNQDKSKKMGILSNFFKKLTESKQLATEELTDVDGKVLTIEKKGEEIAIGDSVKIDGEPAPDGAYEIVEDDAHYRLIVNDNSEIENIEQIEPENELPVEEPAPAEPTSEAPQETFSAEIESLRGEIEALKNEIKAMQFSQQPKIAPKSDDNNVNKLIEIKNKFKR